MRQPKVQLKKKRLGSVVWVAFLSLQNNDNNQNKQRDFSFVGTRFLYEHCVILNPLVWKVGTYTNSTHAPLNRDKGGLLSDTYLHSIIRKNANRPLNYKLVEKDFHFLLQTLRCHMIELHHGEVDILGLDHLSYSQHYFQLPVCFLQV